MKFVRAPRPARSTGSEAHQLTTSTEVIRRPRPDRADNVLAEKLVPAKTADRWSGVPYPICP